MVGNTLVRYFDSNKTYVEARRQCLSLGSQLLEIWNEEEWNEVNSTLIDISNLFMHYVVYRSINGLGRSRVPRLLPSLASLTWTLRGNLSGVQGVRCPGTLPRSGRRGSRTITTASSTAPA